MKMSSKYKVSDEKDLLQIERIHSLLKEAYWCKGIPKKTLQSAIEGSLCFGIYDSGLQVAFARVVTDKATFAWICDVIVDEKYRGQGLSKLLVQSVVDHPDLQGLRRILLATKDAHSLYEKFNFKVTETPQYWITKFICANRSLFEPDSNFRN
jgi:N-acetylglutamate synthase-like GNAT family acetyltransferase